MLVLVSWPLLFSLAVTHTPSCETLTIYHTLPQFQSLCNLSESCGAPQPNHNQKLTWVRALFAVNSSSYFLYSLSLPSSLNCYILLMWIIVFFLEHPEIEVQPLPEMKSSGQSDCNARLQGGGGKEGGSPGREIRRHHFLSPRNFRVWKWKLVGISRLSFLKGKVLGEWFRSSYLILSLRESDSCKFSLAQIAFLWSSSPV